MSIETKKILLEKELEELEDVDDDEDEQEDENEEELVNYKEEVFQTACSRVNSSPLGLVLQEYLLSNKKSS